MAVIRGADGRSSEVRWSARRLADEVARQVGRGEPIEVIAAASDLEAADVVEIHGLYIAGGTAALRGYRSRRRRGGWI